MAENNPGQDNIAFDATTNQPRLNVDVTYDDNTSLDGIKAKYTDIGNQYNRFVTDARENVHDRQVEHIGNDFGASPYNTNTYYEPAATDFASAMRQQGTQQAFEVGMDRGKKEAEANLNAQKSAYENAATAYNNAYNQYQQTKSSPVMAPVDKSLLPDGVNEDEYLNYIKNAGTPAEGLQRAIDKLGLNNAGVKDWNDQDIVGKVKNELGENSDAWKAYAKHMEERGSNGVSERYADTELGRIWADTYAKNYFKNKYGDSYVAKWQTEYDKTRRLVNNIMGLRNGELNWTDTIVPAQDLPDNMSVGTNWKYIDIIQPEFKDIQETSSNHVKYDNGVYTIDGRAYTVDEVRQKVAEAKGTTVEELDKKVKPLQATEFNNTSGAATWQGSKIKMDIFNAQRWTPTTKEVWETFSGGENAAKEYARYTTVGVVSADDIAQAVLGVNIKEARAIAQFKSENPDGYKRLTDQMTRAYTDATVFEVADGKKAYHTRDGYKVLSAGTVVMNVPDAALNENGEIIDEDLKRMQQLYQERDDGTMDQNKLVEGFEKAREAYAKRIMFARAVTNQTDEQIDKDIYTAILYSSDKSKYKDLKIGDKTAEELLNEFRDKVERNPEDAYREFSGLWELAYKNLGYFFAPTSDGYVTKKLYDEDGNSLVGRYGEDNKPKDKSSNYAMALVSLYANSMDAFTNGSKDGNIDPKFLKADGAEGILYNTLVGTGKILQGNAAFITGAASGTAIGSAVAPGVGSLIGGLIGGIGGAIVSVLTSDGKFHPGDIGYDADHNNNSSKLLRNAINPLSSALWGIDDSKPTRLGQTNDVSQGVEDFISGSASFMGELFIESLITGGAGKLGEAARAGIQRGVGAAARNLLNAGQQFTIKNLADDVARDVVKDLMDPSDEIAEDVANKYIKEAAKDKADDVLGAATKKVSTETSIAKGLSTVPSLDQLDDVSRNVVGALNASANETTSKFMQIVSKLANSVNDLTEFSYKFAKKATQFITKESVIDTLARAGYTGLDDATVNAALEYTRTQVAHLGGAAARQTYQTALISGFLGLAPEQVAKAPANVLTYLSKSIGQFYDNPSAFPGVFGAILKGEMTKDAIKRSFSEISEISAAAAQSGVKFSTDDVVRHLAASGWNKARLAQLTKNITLSRQGLADDIFHDIVNGYTVPQMDEEGNYHQVTVDEYLASGQIINPFIMNGMQLAISGVFRRVQSAAVRAKLDKANAALAATAMDSPDYAARYKAVQKYTAKAAKISDKLLDGNISYSKMKEVADKGMQYLNDADKKLFEGLKRDIKAVDKNFSKNTRAQQAEFLKKRFKATDAVAQAYTNAQVGAFVKYPYFKKLLGGDVANTLSTLEDRATIGKIWSAMVDASEKSRDAVLENKRLKDFWAKQAEMRKLQKEAVKDALRGPNGEVSVINLESSLDSWFNMIDDVARRNIAEGAMAEDQLRLGYLPEAGMLIGKPGDGVPAPARALWMGEDSGNAMAISSADPVMKREVYIKDLVNAYKKGKTEVILADGSTKEFNPQGFSFLDAAIAYNNANTFHRTVGNIIGSGKKTTGAAAVQSGYVQFHGANASKAAAQADLDVVNAKISELEEAAQKSMTDTAKIEDAKARARAKKALSDISKSEDKIMEAIGQQQVSAESLRKAAKVLEEIATTGRRPDGAPSAKELLGIKDDSEAQKVFNAARKRVAEDIKKVQSGEVLSANIKNEKFASSINDIDAIYEDMIRNAAKNNGHFDYDVVARRMLLDNYKPTEKTLPIKEVVGNRLEEVTDFENQPTQINLKYDKNTKSYKSSTLGELSKLDMDNATTKAKVDRELTRLISNDYNSSDRGLKEQYMRAVQDAFSQAKTIMNDQIKLEDIDMNEGGFSHGFFTYLDIVDRILPDKDLYRTAVDTKLVNKLNNLSRDGITLSQLKESILNKIASERLAGNSIDDLVTAYEVLDLADDAGVRATGTGSYESGRLKDMLFEDDGSDAAATDYRLGVSDLYGNKIDTSDMYAQDFNPESLMANRSKNPAQIDYDKLSAKDKSIYNMVRSGVDLSNKEELNEALKTTASVLNKLTNNGSKLYDASLNAARKEASGVVEMAKTIRDEINKAVNELASKDKETKKLIESEAARRSARQTKFNKTSTDNATYDGAAALGIARPQSAVLYSESPAKYNAIAAAIRNNEAGLANTVRAMKAEGVPDAQSILGYFREGRKGVEDLDSLINFDAGSNAGIYQQLKAATDYLKEKGVNTKNLDEKLSEMKSKISDVNSYGDIYGNYNPPEYSLSAALAEVEGKTSFFPDNLRNGIDRLRTDEAGVNTWKAIQASDGISGLHDRFLNADKGMQKAMKKNGWDQINGVVVEYTGAGVSDSPESIIAAITSDASSAEQVFVHAVDPDGNTVDISKMPKDIREWMFDGLEIDAAGTRDKIKIYDDNGVIRAEEAIERGFERDSEPAFRDTGIDEKWASYLADTATKKSYKDMMADIETLRKKASRLDSKTEKLSNAKVGVTDGAGKLKQQSLKSVVEDTQDINYKKYLSKKDYAEYQELKKNQSQINDYLNDKAEVYHSLTGATFNGDAPGYSNMVRLSDFLKQYGYTPDAKELDASKFDAKKMGKELRKGNLATKKNWGNYRIDPTALPSSMDKKSAELTVANLLKFAKEARGAAGLNYIDFDQMWVDKSYLELLARYSNRPLDARGLMGFAAKVSAFPNWVQQQQLAGGWGPINALTLAQVRSAILEDPTKAVAFAKMLADMRNSKTALNSIISRSDLLSRIALETGDGSIVTDLYPVMSKRAGRDDGGVIQTFANKILDRGNSAQAYSRFPKGFRENLKQDVEDFFETPTFTQAMPVLRAQMISMNYDSALSHLNKKFAKRIGKDISAEEIQNAAMQVAYARTQKFFTPQKYWNENYESGLQRIKNENIRKLVGQITGEGTPITILDVASNAFFALRYKQTFVNRFVQGFREMASLPKMLRNQLSQSASLADVTSDMTKVGQIEGVVSLIGISVLAKIWCDALGIPNAWDDFDFNPEGDEVFHMPSVLMKFQNAGQIWMPNSGKLDLGKGIDWGHSVFGMSVDPNKQAYKIDPMFSMFTMPNTVFRAFNTAFNGSTDSYKAPQRGLPFLPTNGVVNSMVNSNVGRALGDELIGSNLLSPFKALHEVITNSTYFGNNIWERKYLPDGSVNPNYDPGRNAASSVMHLLGLDQVLDPNGYNRWVKGGDNMVKQDQVGTIAGSGILQHEYLTAAIHLLNGDIYEAAVEAGELPIKSQKLASGARTEMNTVVKNTLDHYGDEYREAIKHATNTDTKDKAYAEYMKKSADEVARWSKKYGYILGKNQELVASMTRLVTAMTSGEYDDNMAYVQNAYWKASKIAQIESGTNLFLNDSDLDDWLANGGTVESFAEEKNRRSQAYNQALDDEYEARKALIDAKYNPEYLAGSSYEDLRAEQRAVSKKVYTAIMSKFEKQVGEFKNFKEMKAYYENMIASASTTKQKAKYAETYNGHVKEIIAAALANNKLDATILNEATYNGKGLATQLSDYIIIPAGTYYTGKSPRTSYLKDLFEVGYRSRAKLPSDDEVREKWDTVKWLVSHGKPASAASVLEQTLKNVKNGSLYISDVDYSNMVRLQSKLRSKQ